MIVLVGIKRKSHLKLDHANAQHDSMIGSSKDIFRIRTKSKLAQRIVSSRDNNIAQDKITILFLAK